MAGGAKDAWDQVGEHFTDLGRRLSDRYHAHGEESAEAAEEGRRKVEAAVKSVTEQLDRTFTSVGDTLRDPEAQQSLSRAVESLGTALAATFSEAGEEIRKRFGSTAGSGGPAAPDDPSDTTAV